MSLSNSGPPIIVIEELAHSVPTTSALKTTLGNLAEKSLKTLASQFLGFFKCSDLHLFSTQPPTTIKQSKAERPEKKIKMDQQEAKPKWWEPEFSLEMTRKLRIPF